MAPEPGSPPRFAACCWFRLC